MAGRAGAAAAALVSGASPADPGPAVRVRSTCASCSAATPRATRPPRRPGRPGAAASAAWPTSSWPRWRRPWTTCASTPATAPRPGCWSRTTASEVVGHGARQRRRGAAPVASTRRPRRAARRGSSSIRGRLRDLGRHGGLGSGRARARRWSCGSRGRGRRDDGGRGCEPEAAGPGELAAPGDRSSWPTTTRCGATRSPATSPTPGSTVVATADDGPHAVARTRATRPDVLVLDLNLPGLRRRRGVRGTRGRRCPRGAGAVGERGAAGRARGGQGRARPATS